MLEEMVRAWNLVVMDGDALLRAQRVDELLDRARRHDLIGAARDDDPRRGAGREEAEIIHVRRRRDRQEAADLGPPHQKLHADPRAEAEAREPGRLRLGMDRLHPVESRRGVAQLADAGVERTLAAPDAEEVEAEGR